MTQAASADAARLEVQEALPLTPATIAKFLVGNRSAILSLAADRRALRFGLAFVLLASLGREYDAEYLLACLLYTSPSPRD